MQGSEDALKLADPAPPYAHALEEVADHARLLALRVERAVARFRESRNVVEAPGLQTLAIFDSEVDEILRNLDPSRDADGF